MQWTVQAAVALLNLVWIVFFLQPEPFSVSVRKRSSDEEILIGEFCLRPQSDANWTSTVQTVNRTSDETNNSSKTADGSENNATLYEDNSIEIADIQHGCQCNNTNLQQRHLSASELSHVELRSPAPGCEPKILMTFPNMEVCVDVEIFIFAIAPFILDGEETNSSSLPLSVPDLTTPSTSVLKRPQASSEVAREDYGRNVVQYRLGLTLTLNKPKEGPICCFFANLNYTYYIQTRLILLSSVMCKHEIGAKGCCFTFYPRTVNKRLISSYYLTDERCPKKGVILVTHKKHRICADPTLPWVVNIMRNVDMKA